MAGDRLNAWGRIIKNSIVILNLTTKMSLAQLARLLPLPESELQQVLDYANDLSAQDAAQHFSDLLGETPQSIDFIATFNSRRQDASVNVPKNARPQGKKKKAPLHALPARQIASTASAPGKSYMKKNDDDYMPQRTTNASVAESSRLGDTPTTKNSPAPGKPLTTAAGYLISDSRPKSKPSSQNGSRTTSPARGATSKTKVTITGGTPMHGASRALDTLDAAIRSLEMSTNSTLNDPAKRRCKCMATRHALSTAAPNCLACGKIICVKEGLGPCTFCSTPLLSASEVQSMIATLREERGQEKIAAHNASQKRVDVTKKPIPFSKTSGWEEGLNPAEAAAATRAKEHRDRLLGFQAQNAKRTTVKDEAADFDADVHGRGALWMTPTDRAKEVKRMQKILAEREWNARPEYEKRRQVISIDLVGGKAVKRMAKIERPQVPLDSASNSDGDDYTNTPATDSTLISHNTTGGTFSRNPLLGSLIKPVYTLPKGKMPASSNGDGDEDGDAGHGNSSDAAASMRKPARAWRRVQDDLDDNEKVILDGGAYGGES